MSETRPLSRASKEPDEQPATRRVRPDGRGTAVKWFAVLFLVFLALGVYSLGAET